MIPRLAGQYSASLIPTVKVNQYAIVHCDLPEMAETLIGKAVGLKPGARRREAWGRLAKRGPVEIAVPGAGPGDRADGPGLQRLAAV